MEVLGKTTGWIMMVFTIALGAGMYCAGYFNSNKPTEPCFPPWVDVSLDLRRDISASSNTFQHLNYPNGLSYLVLGDGTDQDFNQAAWMRQKFIEFGLDEAEVIPYKVLIQFTKNQSQWVTIYNTIALLRGQIEQDRYVLVGNSRSDWILAERNPTASGTASMLELARAFGHIKKSKGWRPRRSLVFCSWGAEDYDQIGSTEWIKEHANVLSQKAVAYLNIVTPTLGRNNSLIGISSSPVLHRVVMESSKNVPNPNSVAVSPTLFHAWFNTSSFLHPDDRAGEVNQDSAGFLYSVGVPSLDLNYQIVKENSSGKDYHKAVTQLWAEIALNLTESAVLPFDLQSYATRLKVEFGRIKERFDDTLYSKETVAMGHLETAIADFERAVEMFSKSLKRLDIKNFLTVRKANDQLMQLERHFIDIRGLPPHFNHLLFSPSSSPKGVVGLSGFKELLGSVGNKTEAEKPEEWSRIRQYLSALTLSVGAAARSLSSFL